MTLSGKRHLRYESVDSTNAEARRLAQEGEAGPLWITAGEQTAGRGRRGRQWVSKPGNLFATLLLTLPINPTTAAQASFVAALALHDACSKFVPSSVNLSLKWPNDLLLDQQKLAGILLETVPSDRAGQLALAIGCGVNLEHAPSQTSYSATWLNVHVSTPVSPQQFHNEFAACMNMRLDQWKNGDGFDLTAKAWQNRASHIGKVISLTTNSETLTGKFLGLANNGALDLEFNDGTQKQFHAGDVSFRPQTKTRSADAE